MPGFRTARRFAASAVLAGLLAYAATAQPAQAQVRPGMMMLEGTLLTIAAEGEAKAVPDVATIQFGVLAKGATAEAAMAENARQMTSVLAALKKAGVADRSVQTTGVSLNPDYVYAEREPPKVTGYQSSNMVSAKVRDLKNLGKIMDALVSAGVNQMNGVSFGVDNPEPLLDRAREQAIKTARARADLYAAAAGMKVVRILSIQEGGAMAPPMPMPMMAKAADMGGASTPIQQGEAVLGVNVTVAFELK
jgi:uncharacterized protein YggE